MKAIVIHEFGPPDVLKYESVPDPAPRAGRSCRSSPGSIAPAWSTRSERA